EGLSQNADVYHFHDPELIPVGLLLKAAGRRVIYDAHEDVTTDVLAKEYLPAVLRRQAAWAIGKFERGSARAFDRVIAATPTIAARFDTRKTETVQNFPLNSERSTNESLPFDRRPPEI